MSGSSAARALRLIAGKGRMSSLDIPIIEDAAGVLDDMRTARIAIEIALEGIGVVVVDRRTGRYVNARAEAAEARLADLQGLIEEWRNRADKLAATAGTSDQRAAYYRCADDLASLKGPQ